jgi:hypothetical protein
MAIGGADQEARLAHAIVAPAAQHAGEFGWKSGASALVHGHGPRGGGGNRRRAAAIGQFGDLETPGDALAIALDQLRLGRAADLSPGDDVDSIPLP